MKYRSKTDEALKKDNMFRMIIDRTCSMRFHTGVDYDLYAMFQLYATCGSGAPAELMWSEVPDFL